MMRLLARISVPPERAREAFCEVDTWPLWMPGVERLEVVERSGDRIRAEITQRQFGLRWDQVQEISFTRNGLRQRLIEGRVRFWECEWRFLRPPDGRGTTVAAALEMDLGLKGLFIPTAALQRSLDEVFEQTVSRVQNRARAAEAEAPSSWLRVSRSLRGLEVEVAGELYVLRPVR